MKKSAEQYIREGWEFKMKGKRKEAIECFTKALELKPHDDNVYALRGFCKYALKEYIEAIHDYSAAIRINPKNSMAYYHRAECKENLGDFKGAVEDCLKMTEIDPNDAFGYSHAAYIYFKLDDEKAERKMRLKSKKITPMTSDDFYHRAIDKKSEKKYSEAIEDLTTAMECHLRGACISAELLGECKEKMGLYNEAIMDYMTAIWINPDDHTNFNYSRIARCKEILGDLDEALAHYSKAIENSPDYFRTYEERGKLKIKMGRIVEGNADIQKSISLKVIGEKNKRN